MSPHLHHTHYGPNVLCPQIGALIKILFLFIGKTPNNKNALVQVIGLLNRPLAFPWYNTGPVYRHAYAPLWQSCVNKNIERHTQFTVVSRPNPEQWLMIHISALMMMMMMMMMMIRWSTHSPDHYRIIGYVNKLGLFGKICNARSFGTTKFIEYCHYAALINFQHRSNIAQERSWNILRTFETTTRTQKICCGICTYCLCVCVCARVDGQVVGWV